MASHKAVEIVERFLNQRLIVKEFIAQLIGSAQWQRLAEQPVTNIGGDLAMAVDIDAMGHGWVRTERDREIRYTAGMAYGVEGLPEPIKQALGQLDRYLESGADPDEAPASVTALLRPWKRKPVVG